MSESTIQMGDGRTLRAVTEQIEVTSLSPRPDPAWTFTDAVGHVHAFNGSTKDYPTLAWVQDEEPYVVMEYGYPEEYPGSGHYECRHCGEHIEPGEVGPSPFREFIAGPTSYYLDGAPISEQEARALLGR